MKKILLLIILICLAVQVSADNITALYVPEEIHLGETLQIYGVFKDTSGDDANILCSFYILDFNLNLVDRPDDEFTDATGRFSSSSLTLNQPPFFHNSDYNVTVVCDTALSSQEISVLNVRDIAFSFFTAFDWFFLTRNQETYFIAGIFGIFFVMFLVIVWYGWKIARSK